jgi:hypothetical protein
MTTNVRIIGRIPGRRPRPFFLLIRPGRIKYVCVEFKIRDSFRIRKVWWDLWLPRTRQLPRSIPGMNK